MKTADRIQAHEAPAQLRGAVHWHGLATSADLRFSRFLPAFTIAACLLLIPASSFAEKRNFGFNFADTVAGELNVIKNVDGDNEVVLAGKRILKGDTDHVLWFVADARPAAGLASAVLLGFDTGDNSCRFMYRIVDFSSSAEGRLTPEFGDCSEYSSQRRLKSEALERSVSTTWVLSGFSNGGRGPGAQFVYRAGKIFRGSRQITGLEERSSGF